MKNTLTITILVLLVLVLGFLFIKEKNSRDTRINEWPETVPATPTNNNSQSNSNGNNQQDQNNPTQQQEDYEYEDNRGFYVDLAGRVITEKTATGSTYKIIYFDKPNGERDFIVSIFTPSEWQKYWNSLSSSFNDYRGQVTFNGATFDYYVKPAVDPGISDPQTLHYYITQHDGVYYQVYTTNPANVSSFGFLQ